ncbi:hypothetical protein [Jeongeupia chitinilytica]|uniref:Uncharacterized protein n=1 Tax=Jeongeupia chitinilytica TaxID=1041641 RepID=A0ABQ3H2C4_9NEIS|nr:hypothetical protein [Jeongeupia chitinilytica]GHD66736.1 hypothetical protein GCM10007350_29400 [Jeongeupia chitinilytica]
MHTTFKLAVATSLLALAQFASAGAMPMQQNEQLHPAWQPQAHATVQSAPSSRSMYATHGQLQNKQLHELAGPGSMAG